MSPFSLVLQGLSLVYHNSPQEALYSIMQNSILYGVYGFTATCASVELLHTTAAAPPRPRFQLLFVPGLCCCTVLVRKAVLQDDDDYY